MKTDEFLDLDTETDTQRGLEFLEVVPQFKLKNYVKESSHDGTNKSSFHKHVNMKRASQQQHSSSFSIYKESLEG